MSYLLYEWNLPNEYMVESQGRFGLVDRDGYCGFILAMSEEARKESKRLKGGSYSLALVYHPDRPEHEPVH